MKSVMSMKALLVMSLVVCGTACDDSDDAQPEVPALVASEVEDLDAASTSRYTLFSFADDAVVANTDSATSQWDIGFRGTTIILNSGVSGPGTAAGQIVDGIFEELVEARTTGYAQDNATTKAIQGNGGWYTYTGTTSVPNHAVLPTAGKVIMVKTSKGNYVKMEIISYYQGNPSTASGEFANPESRPASRHYTFRYLHQPDGTTNLEATE